MGATQLIRILAALVILPLAAISFPALDKYRRKHWYGWTSPAMDEHWERLWRERTQHAAKNVLSEWVRLDAQRAGKLFAFLLTVSVLLNVALLRMG